MTEQVIVTHPSDVETAKEMFGALRIVENEYCPEGMGVLFAEREGFRPPNFRIFRYAAIKAVVEGGGG